MTCEVSDFFVACFDLDAGFSAVVGLDHEERVEVDDGQWSWTYTVDKICLHWFHLTRFL